MNPTPMNVDVSPPDVTAPRSVGRYFMFDAFARGGMATVHLGRLDVSPGVSRLVAIKRLDRAYDVGGELAARLREEARVLSRVRHPNVVPVLDVVESPSELCLVLEYVHGTSLAALIEEASSLGERLPRPVVVAILCDVLRGLAAAHDAKGADGASLALVHRDVSPQNILVGADGAGRLLDFGVAKAHGRSKLTATGTTLGKVVYMSPEQRRALPLTGRSDLYGVGVVLWECLTGRPFTEALERPSAPPPPSAIVSDVPAALDAIVQRALAVDVARRYGTAEEMAQELADACPLASELEVSRLLERLGGDDLERRSALVTKVEAWKAPLAPAPEHSEPPSPASEPPPPPASSPPLTLDVETDASLSRTVLVRRPPRARTSSMVAALGVSVLVAVVAILSFARAPQPPMARANATAIARVAAPGALVPIKAAPEAASPPALATLTRAAFGPNDAEVAVDDVAATDSSRGASTAPRARGPVPVVKARKPRAPSRAAGATNACEVPFTFDDDGRKRYKPECLK
ncbi:MAG: serine/threonine protein kinase [Myxococcales bacterium]|nr:serine/threonine protein kinase [Myxococcales bacterium]